MIIISACLRQWFGLVDQVGPRLKSTTGRGRPYVYPTTVLLRCYLLMLVYPPVRSWSALHDFLLAHTLVCQLVGLTSVPHRTTFMRRFTVLEHGLKARIWAMGWAFVLAGYVELHVLMADGSLHQAAGPSWPASYKERGELPAKLRHVDQAAGWGKSPYHGWVWGYRTHPVVALTPDLEPIPLLADARPANVQDNTIILPQLAWLPDDASVLLLDSSYEDEAIVKAWEQHDEAGTALRWLVIDPKARLGQPSEWRQQLQVRRQMEETALYALRGQLMEPFFAHWKDAFDLARLPLQGTAARCYLLLALYGYQLLIWSNLQAGRPTYAYKHLILGTG
jgi:DDE family transposase